MLNSTSAKYFVACIVFLLVAVLSIGQIFYGEKALQRWTIFVDVQLPQEETTYWCSIHKGPHLNKKHHIVSFDAIDYHRVNNSNSEFIHHMILYLCHNNWKNSENGTRHPNFGGLSVEEGFPGDYCYQPKNPEFSTALDHCKEYINVWAKGSKKVDLPSNIGLPIGPYSSDSDSDSEVYFMLETHLENPNRVNNTRIKSRVGFRYSEQLLHLSTILRDVEAGFLTVGLDVDVSVTVPPSTEEFVVAGHCSPKCTGLTLPEGGITIFRSHLHTHSSGRKVKLRHFRGDLELPPIDYDDQYDFHKQKYKDFGHEGIRILPGDQLTIECTYDSTWKKGQVVIGGLSSDNEMCQGNLWYYPRIPLDICTSTYSLKKHFRDIGITHYTVQPTRLLDKVYITEPEYLRGSYEDVMNTKFNWTRTEIKNGFHFIKDYELKHRFGSHTGDCQSRKESKQYNLTKGVTYPNAYTIGQESI